MTIDKIITNVKLIPVSAYQAAFQKIKPGKISKAEVAFKQGWPAKLAMILNNRNFKSKSIFWHRKQIFFR
jgi:hypothetical protein